MIHHRLVGCSEALCQTHLYQVTLYMFVGDPEMKKKRRLKKKSMEVIKIKMLKNQKQGKKDAHHDALAPRPLLEALGWSAASPYVSQPPVRFQPAEECIERLVAYAEE